MLYFIRNYGYGIFIKRLLIVVFLLVFLIFYGQFVGCDMIYSSVDVLLEYDKDVKGFFDYVKKEFVLLIVDCIEGELEIIISLYIMLIIDCYGKVMDVIFLLYDVFFFCQEKMRVKFLFMIGW